MKSEGIVGDLTSNILGAIMIIHSNVLWGNLWHTFTFLQVSFTDRNTFFCPLMTVWCVWIGTHRLAGCRGAWYCRAYQGVSPIVYLSPFLSLSLSLSSSTICAPAKVETRLSHERVMQNQWSLHCIAPDVHCVFSFIGLRLNSHMNVQRAKFWIEINVSSF